MIISREKHDWVVEIGLLPEDIVSNLKFCRDSSKDGWCQMNFCVWTKCTAKLEWQKKALIKGYQGVCCLELLLSLLIHTWLFCATCTISNFPKMKVDSLEFRKESKTFPFRDCISFYVYLIQVNWINVWHWNSIISW